MRRRAEKNEVEICCFRKKRMGVEKRRDDR
jgi:hypothetical protein